MTKKDEIDKPKPAARAEVEVEGKKIPDAVVKRLSLYARVLEGLDHEGVDKISSAELARRLGLNSSQVRKDLACFGQFGVPGFGYWVRELRHEVHRILGKDREVFVILVGVGNLGAALLSYKGFLKQGFTMLWGFDINPEAATRRGRSPIPIFHVDELDQKLSERPVDMAVLALPAKEAQAVADRLVALGVKAILNFVPIRLTVPPSVHVRHVDLSLELESLSFYLGEE
ncbi:MAG: redox-sensing transcriptional repressor Rex [Candidatus Sumerlaeia bacterium]|nr:redox-sensing transcriptional repressor Rex [Candidatus Sumerlaeia bacterium]